VIDHVPNSSSTLVSLSKEGGSHVLPAYEDEINKLTAILIRQEAELVETRVELNKRLRSLQFFQILNKRILAAKSHHEIYQVVVHSLVEIGFDKAVILKRQSGEYGVIAHYGYTSDTILRCQPAPALLRYIEEKGELLVNGENRDSIDCSYEKDLEVRYIIAVSFVLRQSDTVPYILLAGNATETTVRRSRLTPVDLQILHTLTRQIAVAVENALFYEQLKSSEKKYRLLYEKSVEGLFQIEADGKIINANKAMAVMLGYSSPASLMEAVDSDSILSILEHDEFARFSRIITEMGRAIGYETQLHRKDGTTIWVSISARCERDVEERPLFFEGSVVDISAMKRARQLDIEKTAAEKANRAKSDFLANMSHEIRTPMNGVLGMTTLLMGTNLNSSQQHYVNAIRQSSEALLTIINEILDFSKIEAGKVSLEVVEFNLRSLLDDVLDLVETRIDGEKVTLCCCVRPDAPQIVRGDPVRIRQVLLNLVFNAIKFTREGDISIEVEAADGVGGVHLRFSIRDTGPGISVEKQKILFDSFTQVDSSLTRTAEGTGLGLAISRQLIELMGGTIGVNSSQGKGAEFWFTLQLEQGDDYGISVETTVCLAGLHVLIAEENESVRTFLCSQLEAWGARVSSYVEPFEFLSGYKAAVSREKNEPLLVIASESCAEMSTSVLVRAGHVKTIVLSNSGGMPHVGRGSDETVFLARPIRYGHLLTACTCMIAGKDLRRCVAAEIPDIWRSDELRNHLRILVVEDHTINQQVVVGILNRLGCVHIDAVSNGLEAVKNFEIFPYDLIFMDVSMPVMDGLEATGRIRALEKRKGARVVPIVALTAHAMSGDRERCLGAGMTEVLTKPVQPQALTAVLDRWSEPETVDRQDKGDDRNGASAIVVPAGQKSDAPAAFDLYRLEKRLLGDVHHARIIARYFQDEVEQQVAELEAAIAAEDLAETLRLSHRLKGSTGNVQAEILYALTRDLNASATLGDWEQIRKTIGLMRSHCPLLIQTIAEQLSHSASVSSQRNIA
jgi:PAS domain S-box-containing protein